VTRGESRVQGRLEADRPLVRTASLLGWVGSVKNYTMQARCLWLTPVILATQGAEIRRITVRSQPGQIVHETLS
jgi:hypothetical protein